MFSSSNITKVVKPRWIRWLRHVADIIGIRNAHKMLFKNLKGGDCFRDLGIAERTTFMDLRNRISGCKLN
jgi:hypothetical protein